MSSTPSNDARLSSANGAARARPWRRARRRPTRPSPLIATICCARTSSGLRGIARRLDLRPSCIARATAAQATRSPRNFGKMTPSLTAPTWWPAAADALQAAGDRRRRLDLDRPDRWRPCRCRARATRWRRARGSCPAFSASSISTRCARAIEPWCARTSVSPASSLSAPASRSARRRLLTKMQRRAVRANELEQPRMDRRPDRRAPAPRRRPLGPCRRRHVLDRHFDVSRALRHVLDAAPRRASVERACVAPASTIVDRPRPLTPARWRRGLAAAEEARDLVERPLRGRQADALQAARRASASSRSSESARCAPRLVGTSAWISSMMTVSTERERLARACDVSSR